MSAVAAARVGMSGAGSAESINPTSSFQNVDQARILNLHRLHDQAIVGDKTNVFYAVLSEIIDFATVRKVGPADVRVPLKPEVAQLPTLAAFYSCAVIQDGTTTFTKRVGTAPVKFVSFNPGQTSEFVADTYYWKTTGPNVDRLLIDSSYSAESARMNALLAGDLDILPAADPRFVRANSTGGKIVVGNQGPGEGDAEGCRRLHHRRQLAASVLPSRAMTIRARGLGATEERNKTMSKR